MTGDRSLWIGADPGGRGNFGLALWHEGETPITRCVDCAEEAAKAVVRQFGTSMPAGVGVDAPLWWSAGISSDRKADQWLRKTYKLSGGAVQTANSLKGAALVQAAMFVERLRSTYGPSLPVTEVHPKAVLRVLTAGDWPAFAARFGLSASGATEHERDALIAAIAAREGFSGRWCRDLSLDRLPEEQDPRTYWLAPVHYYWPET